MRSGQEKFQVRWCQVSSFMCQVHVSFGFDSDQIFGFPHVEVSQQVLQTCGSLKNIVYDLDFGLGLAKICGTKYLKIDFICDID